MDRPLVSVVIACRNEEKYIKDSIESIISQSYKNIEIIVIDDYSTDSTYNIIKSFADKRIRCIQKDGQPPGVATSKNLGVKIAKGEYIAIQDADDTSHESRISEQLKIAMYKPGKIIVGCNADIIKRNVKKTTNLPSSHEEIQKGFISSFNRAKFISGTLLAPREALTTYPMREKFIYMADWDQILRLWESGEYEFLNTKEVLYNYYLRPASSITYNKERVSYNVFLRNCESRRKRRLNEYESLEEFQESINTVNYESIKWKLFWSMKKIQHRLFI